MSRLEEIIESMNDAVEILKCYEEMMKRGECNTCAVNRSCQYCPEQGDIVRVNCPLYVKPKEGIVRIVTPQEDKGNESQV